MSSLPPTPNPDQARGVTVEEIVSGTRCSPLTLKEFEAFLIHEEHSVENLQFTVWYRSYCERFSALAPEYQDLAEPPAQRYTEFSTPAGSIRTASSIRGDKDSWWTKIVRRRSTVSERSINLEDRDASGEVGLGVDVDGAGEGSGSTDLPLFHEKPSAPPQQVLDRVNTKTFSDTSSINTDTTEKRGKRFPNLRFANLAPLMSIQSRKELPPDTPMPFIEEIQLITTTFFLPGATKELNIDARLRRHILKSLRPVSEDGVKSEIPATTHPDVFKEAAEHVYNLMERSLPHYLQWAKGNTNTPKQLFWYGVGITDMGIGIMFAMIIMYYAHARWWRIFSFLFFQFGAMQAYSASRYFCSQVHGRTSRQLYPWELSDVVAETDDFSAPSAPTFTVAMHPGAEGKGNKKGVSDLAASLPFLFEPEPVVSANADPEKVKAETTREKAARYRGKFFASMKKKDGKRMAMFGPERVVEDPYIKYVHNQQMKEILWVGAAATFVFLCIVVALPERRPR